MTPTQLKSNDKEKQLFILVFDRSTAQNDHSPKKAL
jgi:hypothetical protein